MKQILTTYTFVPATKTVNLLGLNVPLNQILLISDSTRGRVLYSFADSLGPASYTQGTNSVLVLNAATSTTGFSISDKLTIFYDDGVAYSNAPASVSVSNFPSTQAISNFPATQAVSGPLTNTQLRASAVPISGTVTANTGLSQPLTNTQLRASSVPVTIGTGTAAIGTVSVTSLPATPAGTNLIGSVNIGTLPSIPAGGNAIGSVTVTSLPSVVHTDDKLSGVSGATFCTAGTSHSGNYYAIQIISNTVFDSATGLVFSSNAWDGDTWHSQTFPAGTVIYGNFSNVKLTSGIAIAYKS
jgi:hypothetical protein